MQLKILMSYKMQLFLDLLDVIINVLIYFFLAILVDPTKLAELGYSSDYLAFSITGIALSRYIWNSIARISHRMQREISIGTFESIVTTDTKLSTWVIGQSFFGFIWSSLWFFGTLIAGYLVGAKLTTNPILITEGLLIVLLTVIVHFGIGIMMAGMSILHKQIETLLFVFAVLIEFFGGVLYPLGLLNKYPILYYLAQAFPFTHGLEAFRKIMILGYPITHPAVYTKIFALLAFLPIFFLSFIVLEHYYEEARKRGELSSY